MKLLLALAFLLLATVADAAQVTLTWTDNSNDETQFVVERRLKTDPVTAYAQIGTTAANVAVFVDSTVVVGTLYCYRVKAANATGQSGYSGEACLLTTPTGLVIVFTP